MIYLAPLIGIIGAYLYHLRGGGYFRKGKSTLINRLLFVLPVWVLVVIFLGINWQTGAFLITLFVTISLGHGLFMDMGRWKPSVNEVGGFKEHEYPVTWIIGAEDYRWPFWKSWLHNFIGMSLVGAIRHASIWCLYGLIPVNLLIIYTSAGLLHSLLYEIGHQLGKILDFFRPYELTAYGEHLVGFLMLAGLWVILWM